MPILDIQQRFRELGRIRTGIQVPNKSGRGTHPEKLARFRLTSEWQHLIEQAAEVFGGEARPWDNDGAAEFEVIVEVDSLPVVIPPGEVLDQWYEMWSGGGCQRRCDGVRQVLQDRPCQCPADPMERQELAGKGQACKPTTRLRLMLPDVADVGIWRLESHGFHAAAELGGSAGLVAAATKAGAMIPADLRLASREGARRPGTPKKSFYVPALSFRGTLGPVLDALGILDEGATMPRILGVEARPSLESGGRAALPAGGSSFDPAPTEAASFGTAPPPPAPPAPAEVVDDGPPPPPAPTGFAPPAETEGFAPPPETPPPAPEAYEPPAPSSSSSDVDSGPAYSGPQLIGMKFTDRGIKDRAHRLRMVSWLVHREISSGKDLKPAEVRTVLDLLNDDDGFAELLELVPPLDPEAGQEGAEEPAQGSPAPEPPKAAPEVLTPDAVVDPPRTRRRRAPASSPDGMDGAQWRAMLAERQVKVTEVLREAQRLARAGDVKPPETLDEIAASGLAEELLGFVEATAASRS